MLAVRPTSLKRRIAFLAMKILARRAKPSIIGVDFDVDGVVAELFVECNYTDTIKLYLQRIRDAACANTAQ